MSKDWMVRFRKNQSFLRSIGVNDMIDAGSFDFAYYGGVGCQDPIPIGRIKTDENGFMTFELFDEGERAKHRLSLHMEMFGECLKDIPEKLQSTWYVNESGITSFDGTPIEIERYKRILVTAFNASLAAFKGDWCANDLPPRDTSKENAKLRVDLQNASAALTVSNHLNRELRDELFKANSKISDLENELRHLRSYFEETKNEPSGRGA